MLSMHQIPCKIRLQTLSWSDAAHSAVRFSLLCLLLSLRLFFWELSVGLLFKLFTCACGGIGPIGKISDHECWRWCPSWLLALASPQWTFFEYQETKYFYCYVGTELVGLRRLLSFVVADCRILHKDSLSAVAIIVMSLQWTEIEFLPLSTM